MEHESRGDYSNNVPIDQYHDSHQDFNMLPDNTTISENVQ